MSPHTKVTFMITISKTKDGYNSPTLSAPRQKMMDFLFLPNLVMDDEYLDAENVEPEKKTAI